jgi:hypothetical protein
VLIKTAMIKTANYKLPENSRLWNQEILKYLFEQHEWINADNYFLRWGSAFDGDKGFATGVIVLSRSNDTISIPVIVKDFELEPLDVFFYDGSFRPLTERTVEQVFTDTDIAEKLIDGGGDAENLAKDFFPPRWGKYLTASANPERICSALFIDEEDRKELAERIKQAAAHFHGNDTAINYVRSILRQENPKEEPELTKVSSALISSEPVAGFKIDYMENDTHLEKTGSYIVAYNFLKEAFGYDKPEIDALLEKAEKNVVAVQTREKLAALGQKDMSNMPVVNINEDAKIVTQTKSGQTIEGQVIPRTYNFELRRFTRNKLLVDRERNILAMAEKMVGIRKGQDFNSLFTNKRMIMARPGLIVSFAWKDSGGTMGHSIVAATEPAKIISVEEFKGVGKLYNLISSFGSRHRVMVVEGLNRPVFDRKNEYNAIYLPEKSVILSATKMVDLVSTPEEFKKVVVDQGEDVSLSKLSSTNEILLRGLGFNKSANATEVTLRLVDKGVPYEKASEAVKLASLLGHTTLYVDRPEVEKQASFDEAPFEELVEELRSIRNEFDLVKIAAEIKDVDTLDKVLSLNLINKRNLIVFMKMLPEFKQTVRNLAHLLVASRIGEVGVNENAIEDAMNALQSLVEKMEGSKIRKI